MLTARFIVIATLASAVTILSATVRADESAIPKDMVYVGHGPSVMGIDKEVLPDSGKKLTAWDKRMTTPW